MRHALRLTGTTLLATLVLAGTALTAAQLAHDRSAAAAFRPVVGA
jgi:hypothetical protein